jgi:hypothetical protein
MGKCSPETSYRNIQKATKSSKFAAAQQAKNTVFNRKDKKK